MGPFGKHVATRENVRQSVREVGSPFATVVDTALGLAADDNLAQAWAVLSAAESLIHSTDLERQAFQVERIVAAYTALWHRQHDNDVINKRQLS